MGKALEIILCLVFLSRSTSLTQADTQDASEDDVIQEDSIIIELKEDLSFRYYNYTLPHNHEFQLSARNTFCIALNIHACMHVLC